MNRRKNTTTGGNAYNNNAGYDQGTPNNFSTRQQHSLNTGSQQPLAPRQLKVQVPNIPIITPSKTPLKPILRKDNKPTAVVTPPPEFVETPKKQPEEVAQPVPVPELTAPAVSVEDTDVKETIIISEEDGPDNETMSQGTESADITEENGNGPRKPFFKKIFGGVRKKPSIRAKERKIRQNRHLRKVILPKNALMALYEIKGIQIGDFIINSNMEGGFTALVTVNNCEYEGTGNSKGNAKTNACEKALRDYIINKMMQKPRTPSVEPMDTSEATNGDENNLTVEEADDVPMINLASYALYKLFIAWENEGFHVPEFHTSGPPANSSQHSSESGSSKKSSGRSELPTNWEIMHPATLLCIMRPRLTYTDCGSNGDTANPIQTVKVIVDDQQFIGTGRSKKIARKNVAIAVCNSLFGTNFIKDE